MPEDAWRRATSPRSRCLRTLPPNPKTLPPSVHRSAASRGRLRILFACGAVLSAITACVANRNRSANLMPTSGPVIQAPQSGRTGPASKDVFRGCDLCHIDVADEMVGTRHLAKGIGCVRCHGPSRGHVQDENNQVRPDRVFARNDVDKFCGKCHRCKRPEAAKPRDRSKAADKTCTECHGSHRVVRAGGAPPASH
jgi:hypothetical protein